jgi:cyanate permease
VSALELPSRSRRAIAAAVGVAVVAAVAYVGIALAPSASAATNVLIKGAGSGRCLTPAANNAPATTQNCATATAPSAASNLDGAWT